MRPAAALSRHRLGVLVTLGAGLLRLLGIGAESLWIDEAASLYFVREHSLGELLVQVPLAEPHPPLYYALLDLWTGLVGTSATALRLPSAVFGTAAVAVVYLIGVRLADRRAGGLAAALMAVGQLPLAQSQEARMYGLLAFATVLSFWTFLRVLEDPTDRRVAVYVAAAVLVGSTHTFGLLAIAAQAAYVLWTRPPGRWAPRFALIGLGMAPWLALTAARVLAGGTAPARVAWIPEASGWALARTPAGILGLDAWLGGSIAALLVAPVGVLALVGASEGDAGPAGSGEDRVDAGLLLALWLVVGLLVPFLASYLVFPVFRLRYTIVAAPALLLLVAIGVDRIRPRALALGVGIVLLVAASVPLHGYYLEDRREQWDEAAAFVGDRAEDSDVVLVGNHRPGWVQTKTAFTYYFARDEVPVHGITDETEAAQIDRLVEGHDRVWLVLSHIEAAEADRIRQAVGPGPDPHQRAWSGIGIEVDRFEPNAEMAGAHRLSTGGSLPR